MQNGQFDVFTEVSKVSRIIKPKKIAILKEIRALWNISCLPFQILKSRSKLRKMQSIEKSYQIILFPGFACGDSYMKPLAYFLKSNGHNIRHWGLGRNMAGLNYPHRLEDVSSGWNIVYPHNFPDNYMSEDYKGDAGVPFLCDQAVKKMQSIYRKNNTPMILIGWSLGGYIARECARELPDSVIKVITMGAPVIGGPKYTRLANYFEKRGFDLDWIERQIHLRDKNIILQPVTAIFSKSDSIVSWRAALDYCSPNTDHYQVNCSHLGMVFNSDVWSIVLNSLEQINH